MPVVTASGNDVGTALATADEWAPGPIFVTAQVATASTSPLVSPTVFQLLSR